MEAEAIRKVGYKRMRNLKEEGNKSFKISRNLEKAEVVQEEALVDSEEVPVDPGVASRVEAIEEAVEEATEVEAEVVAEEGAEEEAEEAKEEDSEDEYIESPN